MKALFDEAIGTLPPPIDVDRIITQSRRRGTVRRLAGTAAALTATVAAIGLLAALDGAARDLPTRGGQLPGSAAPVTLPETIDQTKARLDTDIPSVILAHIPHVQLTPDVPVRFDTFWVFAYPVAGQSPSPVDLAFSGSVLITSPNGTGSVVVTLEQVGPALPATRSLACQDGATDCRSFTTPDGARVRQLTHVVTVLRTDQTLVTVVIGPVDRSMSELITPEQLVAVATDPRTTVSR